MSFLSGIFRKKPGGTVFGNLLRGVASSVTGGVLGSGGNMIPTGGTMTNNQYSAAISASTKNGTPAPVTPAAYVPPSTTAAAPLDLNKYVTLPTLNLGASTDSNTILMLAAAAFAAFLIFKK